MSGCAFSNALVALLPGAIVTRCKEHPWHSAVSSGTRLEINLQMEGPDALRDLHLFETYCQDCQLPLASQFVADMAVMDIRELPDGAAIAVEALILDEER